MNKQHRSGQLQPEEFWTLKIKMFTIRMEMRSCWTIKDRTGFQANNQAFNSTKSGFQIRWRHKRAELLIDTEMSSQVLNSSSRLIIWWLLCETQMLQALMASHEPMDRSRQLQWIHWEDQTARYSRMLCCPTKRPVQTCWQTFGLIWSQILACNHRCWVRCASETDAWPITACSLPFDHFAKRWASNFS